MRENLKWLLKTVLIFWPQLLHLHLDPASYYKIHYSFVPTFYVYHPPPATSLPKPSNQSSRLALDVILPMSCFLSCCKEWWYLLASPVLLQATIKSKQIDVKCSGAVHRLSNTCLAYNLLQLRPKFDNIIILSGCKFAREGSVSWLQGSCRASRRFFICQVL